MYENRLLSPARDRHERIGGRQLEQKNQWRTDQSPQVHSMSLQRSRHQINDSVNGNPTEYYEIPVHRVLADINETPAADGTGKHKHCEDCGVHRVRQQMDRVQTEQHPNCRAVCIRIPIDVEIFEFVDTQHEKYHRERKADDDSDSNLPEVLALGSALGPMIGQGAREHNERIYGSPKQD